MLKIWAVTYSLYALFRWGLAQGPMTNSSRSNQNALLRCYLVLMTPVKETVSCKAFQAALQTTYATGSLETQWPAAVEQMERSFK